MEDDDFPTNWTNEPASLKMSIFFSPYFDLFYVYSTTVYSLGLKNSQLVGYLLHPKHYAANRLEIIKIKSKSSPVSE